MLLFKGIIFFITIIMFWKKKTNNENIENQSSDIFKVGSDDKALESYNEEVINENKEESFSELSDQSVDVNEVVKDNNLDTMDINDTQENTDKIDETEDLWALDFDEEDDKKEWFFSKLFWKKENKIMAEENKEEEKSWDSNIFEDFDIDDELWKEVKDIQTNLQKDVYYNLLTFWNILKYLNVFLILIWWILFSYIFIQEDDWMENISLLDPICYIILWEDINNDSSFCSSISNVNKKTNEKLEVLKNNLFKDIVFILPKVYKSENFLNSKEVLFLIEKWEARLKPLEILSEFDDLKNDFESVDKSKIMCNNILISDDFILSASCDAYSSAWEWGIVWIDGKTNWKETVSWTSISVAASFLNYLEKQSSKLSLLEKQKVFSLDEIAWDESGYTKKTSFNIKMKYKTNNLSF